MAGKTFGYATPGKHLQEEFDEVQRLLDSKTAEWKGLAEHSTAVLVRVMEDVQKRKNEEGADDLTMTMLSHAFHWMTIRAVARLGQDMAGVHNRLSKVEKAVKELKLAKK